MTEYTIVKVENGYTLTKEEAADTSSFPEYTCMKYVFVDSDSLLSWMKDNI